MRWPVGGAGGAKAMSGLIKYLRRSWEWWRVGFGRQAAPIADNHGTAGCLLALLTLLPAGLAASEPAVDLRPATMAAFHEYLKLTDARNDEELRRGTNLLWIDNLPAGQRKQAYEALRRGEVKIERLETRENGEKIRCPGGIIHHWVGVVFISG